MRGKAEGAWRKWPELRKGSIALGRYGADWTLCCRSMDAGPKTGEEKERMGAQGPSRVCIYQLIGGDLYFRRHGERGFKVLVNADQGRDEGAARSDGEPRSSGEPSLRNGESELPGLKQ